VRWRLFVGVPVPEPTAADLHHALVPLRERHPQAHWTPPGKLHVTIVFLGATDPAEIPQLERGIAGVVREWAPFDIATGEGGGYLGQRGGVAWLTIFQGRDDIARLSRTMDEALASGAYDKRPPRPHLTLARRVDERLLDDVHAAADELSTRWFVDRAVLYRSHSGPGSALYEELRSFPFGRPAQPTGELPLGD
jgi:2'-5' RNA ligase